MQDYQKAGLTDRLFGDHCFSDTNFFTSFTFIFFIKKSFFLGEAQDGDDCVRELDAC